MSQGERIDDSGCPAPAHPRLLPRRKESKGSAPSDTDKGRLGPPRKGFALAQAPERTIRAVRSPAMRAKRLTSSLIDRIVFDDEAETLAITFRHAGRRSVRYIYYGVPRAIYEALGKAASAGRYFNDRIKGRFECRPDPAVKRYRPD